jgi:hypothetical protein
MVGRDATQDEWLTCVQLWEAQEAWLAGQKNLALVGFAGPEPVRRSGFRDDEALVHELGPAWGSTVDVAGSRIATARLLSGALAATGDLLRAGLLSPYKAWLVTDRLGDLDPDLAHQVKARILPGAATAFPKDLSRRLRRAVVRADQVRAAKRHREGRKDRTVFVESEGRLPGLLGLQAYLPPGSRLRSGSGWRPRRPSGRSSNARRCTTVPWTAPT